MVLFAEPEKLRLAHDVRIHDGFLEIIIKYCIYNNLRVVAPIVLVQTVKKFKWFAVS